MVDFIGAVRDPQFRQDVGQGLVDAAGRGLAMIGGAPVDLTTMFLRPFGYSAPDEQIVGSSEYIGRQMANMGLISEARNPVAEFLSALLIPDPTDIQKLSPYVQRAMSADLVAARPSTLGAAMAMQRGSVGVEPSALEGYRIKNTPLGKTYRTDKGSISVMENSPYSPRPNSITEFFVDEKARGQGIGKKILDDVLGQYDPESISAAVSSPAALNLLYQRGFRPIRSPSASKDEALKMMRDDSSVTMVVPQGSKAPREEAQRGSVGVEPSKFPEVKRGDIKTTQLTDGIVQQRKFDNGSAIELTVRIDKDDKLANAYLEADSGGPMGTEDVPTGTGTATTMYKNALRYARDKGVGWKSDSIMSDESFRMYNRLIEQGVPFEFDGSQFVLPAEKLAAVPDEVLSTNYPSMASRTGQAGQVGTTKKPEGRLITTQSFIDDDIVQQKRQAKDYDVLVSPEFDVDGEKMRVILDGHHSLRAAQMDNVKPKVKEADVSDDDRIALMDKSLDDFLMSVHTGDTDYYEFSTGKPIF